MYPPVSNPSTINDWMGVDASPSNAGNQNIYTQGNIYQGEMNSFEDDFSNEPPLLEELGIDFHHIWSKVLFTLNPTGQISEDLLDDADLTGPILFLFLFASLLLLSGKIQYGAVFGFGFCGCLLVYILLNLMTKVKSIDISHVMSVLGYGLIPLLFVAFLKIFFSLNNIIGLIITIIIVTWCTISCTRLFEATLNMREQRYLIAYPILLFFVTFALISIF